MRPYDGDGDDEINDDCDDDDEFSFVQCYHYLQNEELNEPPEEYKPTAADLAVDPALISHRSQILSPKVHLTQPPAGVTTQRPCALAAPSP